MGTCSAVLLVLITILLPPVGVLIVAECGPDFWINLCLTILGYIPGHIHAFYIEYCYYERREGRAQGKASGVFSPRVNKAVPRGYATGQQTVVEPVAV